MNKITNDYGEFITAVGAPGSQVRCELEFPRLLSMMKDMSNEESIRLLDTTDLCFLERLNLLRSREQPYYND